MIDESCKPFVHLILDSAQEYADENSTCRKVKVGSCIIPHGGDFNKAIHGCNHGSMNCKVNGCRRIRLYGNASKEHRLPSDCDAIHSEVDAICRAAKEGISLDEATIFVTRYPCEACARSIVDAGIKKVFYGRKENISQYTSDIFYLGGVIVEKIEDWDREDNNE